MIDAFYPTLALLRPPLASGAEVHLTAIEYRLLATMISNAEKVLTNRQILREVWGPLYVAHDHYVRVHMSHLRRKL